MSEAAKAWSRWMQAARRILPEPLSRAAQSLLAHPTFFQLLMREEYRTLERIHQLRATFEKEFGGTYRCQEPGRILFNCQFTWDFGWFEYSLASALRLRGHSVAMVGCGGLPHYCELETIRHKRPVCTSCLAALDRRLSAFGLPLLTMRHFVTPETEIWASKASTQMGVDELVSLAYCGIPVGSLARFNLFQYFKGYPFEISGRIEAVFRRCVHSAILIAQAAKGLFEAFKPDMLVTSNGKFLQWAPFVHEARMRGIPFATWEDLLFEGGVIFARNNIAHEQNIDEIWDDEKSRPLSEVDQTRLHEYFSNWEQGDGLFGTYYDASSIRQEDAVRRMLHLEPGRPLVSLFPNVDWDSTSIGIDGAFESMYEWVFSIVDYAQRRPDMDFIVRSHPAEKKVPSAVAATTPMCETVRKRYTRLPKNLRLVEPLNPVTSYALASLSDVVMIYSSTLGIELALRGIKPWVAGRAYYSKKGFTLDLQSRDHMFELLDVNRLGERLSPDELALARRFAHIVRFRRVFTMPFWERGTFSLPSFKALAPGGNAVLEDLCQYLFGKRSMLDMGSG